MFKENFPSKRPQKRTKIPVFKKQKLSDITNHFKARPMPDFSSSFKPKISGFKPTVPKNPLLETAFRGNLKREEFHQKLMELEWIQRAKREFRAQPVPEFR